MTAFDWLDSTGKPISDLYQWVATDEDGTSTVYELKPYLNLVFNVWMPLDDSSMYHTKYNYGHINNLDWKQSLAIRPRNTELKAKAVDTYTADQLQLFYKFIISSELDFSKWPTDFVQAFENFSILAIDEEYALANKLRNLGYKVTKNSK